MSLMPILVLCGSLAAESTETTGSERLILEGVAPRTGTFGHLAVRIRAPWMDGHVELRMPETIHSSLGLHFIDHDRKDMPPLSMLDPAPQWQADPSTGALSYSARTAEGLVFSSTARPHADEVALEFRIRNETGEPLSFTRCQMCLDMSGSADFGDRHDLSRTYAWFDGKPRPFSDTTPTPEQKGRKPWILVPTKPMAETQQGPREWPDGWWIVDQAADSNVLWRVSTDGRHLLGIAWDERRTHLMTNTNIPCLHAGPNEPKPLEPGEEGVWRGTIYLLPNDTEALLGRYRQKALEWGTADSESATPE